MFDRKRYKSFAKQQLKGRWAVPVLFTALTLLISSIFNVPGYIALMNSGDFAGLIAEGASGSDILMAFSDSIPAGDTLTSTISWLVEAVLAMAAITVYLKMSRSPDPVSFRDFIEGLNLWGRAVLAALWQWLWIFLWSMLFVIPGIVKAVAYSQTEFIIAEYKDVSVAQAVRISKTITQGHKGDIFVTMLSFLGWAVLAGMTFGIGFIFLSPYYNMTMTNVYHALMKEAVESGKITAEDLTR